MKDVETGETLYSFSPCGEAVTSLSWENNHLNLRDETHDTVLPKLNTPPSKSNQHVKKLHQLMMT